MLKHIWGLFWHIIFFSRKQKLKSYLILYEKMETWFSNLLKFLIFFPFYNCKQRAKKGLANLVHAHIHPHHRQQNNSDNNFLIISETNSYVDNIQGCHKNKLVRVLGLYLCHVTTQCNYHYGQIPKEATWFIFWY